MGVLIWKHQNADKINISMTVIACSVNQDEHFVTVLNVLKEEQSSQEALQVIETLVNTQVYSNL